MAIIFGSKGRFRELKDELANAGYSFRIRDGLQVYDFSSMGVIQAIVDAYDPLVNLRKLKIVELKAEGLSRIQLVFPSIDDFDKLELVREQWLSVAPAARQATAGFQNLIDIVQAGKTAAAAVNALNTENDIEVYDVVNTPAWP